MAFPYLSKGGTMSRVAICLIIGSIFIVTLTQGLARQVVTSGTVKGPEFTGEVLPGGADWAIRYEDGLTVVDARYAIKADDGTIIQVFNSGANRIVRDEKNPAPIALTTPKFIAPEGPHHWLNHAVFVGTLQPDLSGKFAVHVVIFKLV